MSKRKSIILLSGGLDSLVCLGAVKDEYHIELALTFDYGQKSAKQEIEASKKLAEYYGIKHEVIELPFLQAITKTALVDNKDIPENELYTEYSAKAVWVPNRNGLFLNIAACYADTYNFTHIIFGANKEEAVTFPDNSRKFTEIITSCFEHSTLCNPKVVAPLISMNKIDIVKLALDKNMPLELTRSCYNDSKTNCGKCESCKHLREALEFNGDTKYIKVLFENEN